MGRKPAKDFCGKDWRASVVNLQKAIRKVENCNDEGVIPSEVYVRPVVAAARRLSEGTPKTATELVDSDGNHQWVVTVIVDGPGDYILVESVDG